MTNKQRRIFGNLLLLCPPHHRVIDILHPEDYSIATLDRWKRDREAASYGVLRQLPGIDEDRLQIILTDAIARQQQELKRQVSRFEAALAKLAAIDREAGIADRPAHGSR
jgi:hypothetical protein